MKRLMTLVTVFALAAAPMATRMEAAPPAAGAGLAVPVVGSGPGGTFAGTFTLQKFVNNGGNLEARGILTGIATTPTGMAGSIVQNVSTPVTVGQTAPTTAAAITAQAVCDVLHLDLGPLHLDLLGLRIDLSQVVLDITAESGPGNLLGNLLCAVANLLNPQQTTGLANVLNQILGVLTGA
jgi:hypothetical protein